MREGGEKEQSGLFSNTAEYIYYSFLPYISLVADSP